MKTWDMTQIAETVLAAVRELTEEGALAAGIGAGTLSVMTGLPRMVVSRALEHLNMAGALRVRVVGEQPVYTLADAVPEEEPAAMPGSGGRRWSGFTRPDSLRSRVVAALREAEGRPLWTDEVYQRVQELGGTQWDLQSVRVTLVALERAFPEEFERAEVGRYRYRAIERNEAINV